MDLALQNSLNFICVKQETGQAPKEQMASKTVALSKALIDFSTKVKSDNFKFDYHDLSFKTKPGNEVGFINLTNKNNDTKVSFHISVNDTSEDCSLLQVSCQSGANLSFTQEQEVSEFDSLLKSLVEKLHQDTGSSFSYSTPEFILSDNHIQSFQDALKYGLGADYAIVKQPDQSIQPGLTVKNLDDSNLEIQRNDHPLIQQQQDEVNEFGGDNLVKMRSYDQYLRNVYTALLCQAA